jgi:hypothetical protein
MAKSTEVKEKASELEEFTKIAIGSATSSTTGLVVTDPPTTTVAVPPMTTAITDPLLNVDLMSEASGQGFEDVRPSDFALPQFKLLQSGSPEAKRSEADYIPGAEEGLWLDVISRRIFRELQFIPARFATHYIEWDGQTLGKLVKDHGTNREVMDRTRRDEKFGLDRTPEGTVIVPTANWYGIVCSASEKVNDGSDRFDWVTVNLMARGVISMASTATKVSRRWMSDADAIRLKNRKGEFFCPPLFAMSYRITSQPTKNDQGSWFLPVVNRAGFTLDLPNGLSLFTAAQEFAKFTKEYQSELITIGAEGYTEERPQQNGKQNGGSRTGRFDERRPPPISDVEIPF